MNLRRRTGSRLSRLLRRRFLTDFFNHPHPDFFPGKTFHLSEVFPALGIKNEDLISYSNTSHVSQMMGLFVLKKQEPTHLGFGSQKAS
jgi:hypothetical protein